MKLLLILVFYTTTLVGQEAAYKIYNVKGKPAKFKHIQKMMDENDVIFFGELHDNPIAHWFEVELTKYLGSNYSLTLGAEMFERDEKEYLEQYMNGEIDANQFDSLAGLWNNFFTDYQPVLDWAKEFEAKAVATNVKRKYASQVYKNGLESLDTLSEEVKQDLPPLPIPFDINLGCYQKMLEMMGGHGGENFPKAQAIKDATMAYFIAQNFTPAENNRFLHLNGSFHSDNKEGIIWYLKEYLPAAKVMNISLVLQADVNQLEEEHLGIADFIIVVDEDMTSTY